MYRVPNSGAGACGFISLRLGLELHYVLDKLDAGEKPETFVLNGTDPEMEAAALKLRSTIVGFYFNNLLADIPELGEYTVGGRLWKRIDLLALEMVKKGKDVPEDGPARERLALEYLREMMSPSAWMSTPEYTATALMAKKKVVVYQNGAEINCVNETMQGRPLNLFFVIIITSRSSQRTKGTN
jgi:hypothetical protein